MPLVSLANAYWSPAYDCELPAPDNFLPWLPAGWRKRFFARIRPLAFRFFARPLGKAYRRFGLPAEPDFRRYYTAGDWCAYMDLAELFPIEKIPDNHFYLGPVAWHPEGLSSFTPSSGKKLAYVSLGSSGDRQLLPRILGVLLISDPPAQSITEIGEKLQASKSSVSIMARLPRRSDSAPEGSRSITAMSATTNVAVPIHRSAAPSSSVMNNGITGNVMVRPIAKMVVASSAM